MNINLKTYYINFRTTIDSYINGILTTSKKINVHSLRVKMHTVYIKHKNLEEFL